jgi:multisubunit Na+/H+ antiporter MnhC subunit
MVAFLKYKYDRRNNMLEYTVSINILLIYFIYKRGNKMALGLSALSEQVNKLLALVPNIKADYESLSATITSLKEELAKATAVDPAVQALVDELVTKLENTTKTLDDLDKTV